MLMNSLDVREGGVYYGIRQKNFTVMHGLLEAQEELNHGIIGSFQGFGQIGHLISLTSC